jgi:hypothetical protein
MKTQKKKMISVCVEQEGKRTVPVWRNTWVDVPADATDAEIIEAAEKKFGRRLGGCWEHGTIESEASDTFSAEYENGRKEQLTKNKPEGGAR